MDLDLRGLNYFKRKQQQQKLFTQTVKPNTEVESNTPHFWSVPSIGEMQVLRGKGRLMSMDYII